MDRERLRHRLHAASLRQEVAGPGRPWHYLEVLDETGSTNSDLLARAAAGEDIDRVALIAEHQTAGRGRMGRAWSDAVRAQIALSVGIRPGDVPIDHWGWLPLAAGVAVVDTVAAEGGVHAGLKWPNDVMVADRKLAGILAEVASPKTHVVIGIGLNVTLTAEEAGDPAATSLLDLGVVAPDRDRLIRRLLSELGSRIDDWRVAGGLDDKLVADYRARSMTIGSQVRAVLPGNRTLVGAARGIDGEGRLVVDSAGETVAVSAGDIIHLRPLDTSGL